MFINPTAISRIQLIIIKVIVTINSIVAYPPLIKITNIIPSAFKN